MSSSVALSRRTALKVVLICLGSVIFIAAVVFFIPKENCTFDFVSFRGKLTAEKYLDAVCRQDYAKASKYVYFYDGTPEQPAAGDYTQEWTERAEQLGENRYRFYLAAYDGLKVVVRDGKLCGSVNISVVAGGRSMSYDTQLLFVDGRIADLNSEQIKTEFEAALSGNVSEFAD